MLKSHILCYWFLVFMHINTAVAISEHEDLRGVLPYAFSGKMVQLSIREINLEISPSLGLSAHNIFLQFESFFSLSQSGYLSLYRSCHVHIESLYLVSTDFFSIDVLGLNGGICIIPQTTTGVVAWL